MRESFYVDRCGGSGKAEFWKSCIVHFTKTSSDGTG